MRFLTYVTVALTLTATSALQFKELETTSTAQDTKTVETKSNTSKCKVEKPHENALGDLAIAMKNFGALLEKPAILKGDCGKE